MDYCTAWQVLQRFAARTMRPHLLQRLVFLASLALVWGRWTMGESPEALSDSVKSREGNGLLAAILHFTAVCLPSGTSTGHVGTRRADQRDSAGRAVYRGESAETISFSRGLFETRWSEFRFRA
ncbi:MAG: hypothetical protein ACKO3T_14785, partial [Planctomycetaceae bacterium]